VTFLLELRYGVNFEGSVLDDRHNVVGGCTGKLLVDDLDQDTDLRTLAVEVNGTGPDWHDFLPLVEREGRAWIRRQTAVLFQELSEGRFLPSPGAPPQDGPGTYRCTVKWFAPPSNVWEALTDQSRLAAYTRGAATFEARPGGAIALRGGALRGTVLEAVSLTTLAVSWAVREWPAGPPSTVSLRLRPADGSGDDATVMELQQDGVPPARLDRMEQWWRDTFWDPISVLLGYNYEVW